MASAISRIAVIGAGGAAREIRWLIEDINGIEPSYEFAGYVVSDPDSPGEYDDRDSIVGAFDDLREGRLAVEAVAIGIGSPATRYSMGERLASDLPTVAMPTLIHPSVIMDVGSCTLERGVIVSAGSIVTVNVHLRAYALINRACNIGHEAVVGAGVVVNPLASISGGVVIGDRTLVGTAAAVLQYITVGKDAAVGAGAVVTEDVADGTTVVGVPAMATAVGHHPTWCLERFHLLANLFLRRKSIHTRYIPTFSYNCSLVTF